MSDSVIIINLHFSDHFLNYQTHNSDISPMNLKFAIVIFAEVEK